MSFFFLIDLRYAISQSRRCQNANIIPSDILCFRQPHISDGCLATGIQTKAAEIGIFSLPNVIMTWINCFTFLYSSFPLCLLYIASTSANFLKTSSNKIILLLQNLQILDSDVMFHYLSLTRNHFLLN